MTAPTSDPTPTRDEAVPTVWKLVPIEPTPEMYIKGGIAIADAKPTAETYADEATACYSAMLASAPAPASGRVDAVALAVIEAARCIRHWHDREPDGMVVSAEHVRALWQALERYDEASLSPAATPVSEAGGEPDMRRVCEALGFDPTNHHNAAKCPYCNPDQADAPKLTYRSTQATTCASCGEHKHTPLRRDEMGGYVCLTCIDKRLAALAQPASSPAGGLDVRFDALYDAFKRGVAWGREMPDAVGPEIEKGAYDYADKNTPPLSQSTSAGRVGE